MKRNQNGESVRGSVRGRSGSVSESIKGLQRFSAQEWGKLRASRSEEIPENELIALSKVKNFLKIKQFSRNDKLSLTGIIFDHFK